MFPKNEQYETDVFINCPFDPAYESLLEAILFAVTACGYRLRCASEIVDSGEVRLNKLLRLIADCRLGIHDISRTQLDDEHLLPRFNMPFELGLFLGAKQFGGKQQQKKNCLIVDTDKYRYQKFLSDIAGQDISSHHDDPGKLLTLVRDWLNPLASPRVLLGAKELKKRYDRFLQDRQNICRELGHDHGDLKFKDRVEVVQTWLLVQASEQPK